METIKCFEVQFLFTRIYLSLNGMVDGLNMDKLFTSEQAFPTNAPSNTGNNENLALLLL